MIGCAPDEPATYPVSVRVVGPDGKPLIGVRVAFQSVEHNDLLARGTTSSDGTAMLMTHQAGDGAVAGSQRVAVRPPALYGNLDQPRPKSQIPARFNSYESSRLEFTVDPQETNEFEIRITPN